ncbi:MAG TPA: DUF3099 domain-containing protein [Corynebacterium pollutisoli]|jgi:hypothetical protein|uniref:DUF3099 domain-containing protein n=1 Tax=Corynebacterium pollutisoli TaxID=1610489 RepID=A0A7X8MTD9_9CORY|nr:DUF3099 domain-containing protein [Corynebacterium pollutisoli]HJD78004.1 DUF3099 domain-containing protein [Corynebacterium pollutisoli]
MDQDTFDSVEDPGEESSSRAARRFRLRRRRAELITTAQRSPAENLRHRERVYTWLQASRLPALLISAGSYLWLGDWIFSGILFLISVPLPWIAVVIANGKGEVRDKRTRNTYKPQVAREYYAAVEAERRAQLESPARPELETGQSDIIDHDDTEENPT